MKKQKWVYRIQTWCSKNYIPFARQSTVKFNYKMYWQTKTPANPVTKPFWLRNVESIKEIEREEMKQKMVTSYVSKKTSCLCLSIQQKSAPWFPGFVNFLSKISGSIYPTNSQKAWYGLPCTWNHYSLPQNSLQAICSHFSCTDFSIMYESTWNHNSPFFHNLTHIMLFRGTTSPPWTTI